MPAIGWSAIGGSAVGACLMRLPRLLLIGVLASAGCAAGVWSATRRSETLESVLPRGRVVIEGRVADDPRLFGDLARFPMIPEALIGVDGPVPWAGPRLLVIAPEAEGVAGERVRVTGMLSPVAAPVRGQPVAGRIEARSVEVLAAPADPLFRIGNLLRRRVHDGLAPHRSRAEAALMAGFLIGDVDDLAPPDGEALRLAGLSHFVAVSGSNVALFLSAWWVAAGPLGWGPRRRALIGLMGLAVFVVVTRWEPSVIRAAAMAGLVLGGRLIGRQVDAWTALGGAVGLLLLVSPELVGDVGFQLSVAATAGVILGSDVFGRRSPRWVWTALGATLAAQAAVAPLLLLHFGAVPLFSPLTNVLAAPLVGLATALGGIGVVTGLGPAVVLGLVPAGLVLWIARAAADLPQLGSGGVALVACFALAATRERLRPLAALGGSLALAASSIVPVRPPSGPLVEFIDVGQGDVTLLRGPAGEVILVDGGPDPARLRAELRRRGIARIDLLVVTHGHEDHTGGLQGLAAAIAIETAWVAGRQPDGAMLDDLVVELAAAGVPTGRPEVGWSARVGSFSLEVLGPRRRYASLNDGSIVLRVEAAGSTVLLAGDIEAIAQRDLGVQRADVMKVPHQGAATSDPDWLTASAPGIAVISVGPNQFGHPSPDVVRILEEAGARVMRTDRDGTVAIRLDPLELAEG